MSSITILGLQLLRTWHIERNSTDNAKICFHTHESLQSPRSPLLFFWSTTAAVVELVSMSVCLSPSASDLAAGLWDERNISRRAPCESIRKKTTIGPRFSNWSYMYGTSGSCRSATCGCARYWLYRSDVQDVGWSLGRRRRDATSTVAGGRAGATERSTGKRTTGRLLHRCAARTISSRHPGLLSLLYDWRSTWEEPLDRPIASLCLGTVFFYRNYFCTS